ncbi:Ger(x)C family spore germination protein [Alteribacillus iranensis]|uniref:Spore germination protein n=1 Tax=Alteribacillus iranensis TaxID=930128 RepID=A0A1I2E9I4_9BACI|nr:Ger(x)C family spore germination protein [Alteribacillus iranensis]SFE89353.1 spore germination protein [Alteribacillus iranensis]
MGKYRTYLIMIILLSVLAGCWDEVAIEERGFVIGTAVDVAGENENGDPVMMLTNQFVVPAGVGAPSQQGGGDKKPYMNITDTGTSLYTIDQRMATVTRKLPFYEHLKVLVISDKVLETPHLFSSVLDIFIRNQEMRRGIKVLIAKGEAKKILEIEAEEEPLPSMYVDLLLENSEDKTGIMKVNRVGEIHEYVLAKNDYILPLFTAKKDRINYEGGIVVHGGGTTTSGELSKEEVLGLNIVKGDTDAGMIEVKVEDHIFAYALDYTKSNIKVNPKDIENIDVTVDITSGGHITEVFGTEEQIDHKGLRDIEKAVEDQVKSRIERTISKAQNELHSDIFQIDDKLRYHHYKEWERLEGNWTDGKQLFSQADFTINVDVSVKSTGTSETYQYD